MGCLCLSGVFPRTSHKTASHEIPSLGIFQSESPLDMRSSMRERGLCGAVYTNSTSQSCHLFHAFPDYAQDSDSAEHGFFFAYKKARTDVNFNSSVPFPTSMVEGNSSDRKHHRLSIFKRRGLCCLCQQHMKDLFFFSKALYKNMDISWESSFSPPSVSL